jgi:hypothetical protein
MPLSLRLMGCAARAPVLRRLVELAEITAAKSFASPCSIRWFKNSAVVQHGVIKTIASNRHYQFRGQS